MAGCIYETKPTAFTGALPQALHFSRNYVIVPLRRMGAAMCSAVAIVADPHPMRIAREPVPLIPTPPATFSVALTDKELLKPMQMRAMRLGCMGSEGDLSNGHFAQARILAPVIVVAPPALLHNLEGMLP